MGPSWASGGAHAHAAAFALTMVLAGLFLLRLLTPFSHCVWRSVLAPLKYIISEYNQHHLLLSSVQQQVPFREAEALI